MAGSPDLLRELSAMEATASKLEIDAVVLASAGDEPQLKRILCVSTNGWIKVQALPFRPRLGLRRVGRDDDASGRV